MTIQVFISTSFHICLLEKTGRKKCDSYHFMVNYVRNIFYQKLSKSDNIFEVLVNSVEDPFLRHGV